MLRTDPTQRLSASECLTQPWINGKAHTNEHLKHLEEAQNVMKARIVKREKKAKK